MRTSSRVLEWLDLVYLFLLANTRVYAVGDYNDYGGNQFRSVTSLKNPSLVGFLKRSRGLDSFICGLGDQKRSFYFFLLNSLFFQHLF